MTNYPEWFWRAIDQTKPDNEAFREWLKSAEKERIIQFYFAFDDASIEVADYWNGIRGWSEDSMEDFCNWIVAQGKDFWLKAIAEDRDLEWFADLNEEAEQHPSGQYPIWYPWARASDYFYEQFDESLHEAASEFGLKYVDGEANWLDDKNE